jgi:hypothetical protein
MKRGTNWSKPRSNHPFPLVRASCTGVLYGRITSAPSRNLYSRPVRADYIRPFPEPVLVACTGGLHPPLPGTCARGLYGRITSAPFQEIHPRASHHCLPGRSVSAPDDGRAFPGYRGPQALRLVRADYNRPGDPAPREGASMHPYNRYLRCGPYGRITSALRRGSRP